MTSRKRRSQITTAMVSLGLAATVSTVSAENPKSLLTDFQLRASDLETPPSGPEGYTRIGYWDVDGGGSEGTDGSTGYVVMALYANKVLMDSTTKPGSCVTDIQLRASSSKYPPSGPEGYARIGYWDVDMGGSEGTDGSTGYFMMALYTNTVPINSSTETEPVSCVTDVQLRASDSKTPPSGPEGYARIGYWDADDGPSEGTDGSRGHFMMALYANTAPTVLTEEDVLPAFDDFNLPFQIEPNGSAKILVVPGDMTLRLVPAKNDKTGSAFSQTKVNVVSGFSTFFTFRITKPSDNTAGDGLVFVVQSDNSTVGEGASGLGYANIPNSVGVEFDIWNNEQWRNDSDNNHVGINLNGKFKGPTASVEPSFQDGASWYAWIDYDGSQLEVRTNQKDERPSEALLTQSLNLQEILGDTEEAFVGFTASTGGAFANHDILSWTYQRK